MVIFIRSFNFSLNFSAWKLSLSLLPISRKAAPSNILRLFT